MQFDLNDIPDWLVTSAIALVFTVIVWIRRESLGLGEARLATRREQEKTRGEQSKVIELQERRIKLLETEVASLNRRVDHLVAENEALHTLMVRDGEDG